MKLIFAAGTVFMILVLSAQAQVPTDAFNVRPLLPGQAAPGFTVMTATGESFALDPQHMSKPVVMIFYRGGWCPYCNLYWSQLREIETQLLALGHDYLFISPDRPELLAESIAGDDEPPAYYLASDADGAVARSFGIAFQVDDDTAARYENFGIDLAKISGYEHLQLPAPAVFIIDTDGVIKFSYVNPDYQVRLAPDVLLAAAKSMPDYRLRKKTAKKEN